MTEDAYVFPQPRPGMDHDRYDWTPLDGARKRLVWPQQARVAVCALVTLEHMEWRSPEKNFQVANLAGGYGLGPFPDVTAWSHREYGHRVGVYRVLDVLQKHGIAPTIAIDAMTAQHYPYLVRHCLARSGEIVAHGVSANRVITSLMSEQEERAYIDESIDAVEAAVAKRPHGWSGPSAGESTRTPDLLAQAGIRYVLDWANDEQPYSLRVRSGSLHALPVSLPLDTIHALWDRRVDIDRYEAMIRESFDTLYADGGRNGRLLVLNLHPFLIGQPFRIGRLDAALGYVMGHERVWTATAAEIVAWYAAQEEEGQRG